MVFYTSVTHNKIFDIKIIMEHEWLLIHKLNTPPPPQFFFYRSHFEDSISFYMLVYFHQHEWLLIHNLNTFPAPTLPKMQQNLIVVILKKAFHFWPILFNR